MANSHTAMGLAGWLLAGLVVGPSPSAVAGGLGANRIGEEVKALRDAARSQLTSLPGFGELARRVRVSGDAVGALLDVGDGSPHPDERWALWDARLFADVLLAEDVTLGGRVLANSVALSGEWQLYRLGEHEDRMGELFLELQGLLGSRWLDVRVGRFLIPVGESYQRFSRGARDNPFVTNSVGGAWWWDEGVRLHGSDASDRFGYTASFTGGETSRSWNAHEGDQVSLKLFARPTSWLYLSASGLHSGRMGRPGRRAQASLWLGETWGQGIPTASLVFLAPGIDGVQELDHTFYLGSDAVLTHPAGARLWLSYGSFEIDSSGPSAFDRRLHSFVAELVLEGRLLASVLRPGYLAVRASGLGTYDDTEGYVLDFRYGDAFGPTQRSLEAYSIAAGWRVFDGAVLKIEYTLQDVDLIRDARAIGLHIRDDNILLASLGFHF